MGKPLLHSANLSLGTPCFLQNDLQHAFATSEKVALTCSHARLLPLLQPFSGLLSVHGLRRHIRSHRRMSLSSWRPGAAARCACRACRLIRARAAVSLARVRGLGPWRVGRVGAVVAV